MFWLSQYFFSGRTSGVFTLFRSHCPFNIVLFLLELLYRVCLVTQNPSKKCFFLDAALILRVALNIFFGPKAVLFRALIQVNKVLAILMGRGTPKAKLLKEKYEYEEFSEHGEDSEGSSGNFLDNILLRFGNIWHYYAQGISKFNVTRLSESLQTITWFVCLFVVAFLLIFFVFLFLFTPFFTAPLIPSRSWLSLVYQIF